MNYLPLFYFFKSWIPFISNAIVDVWFKLYKCHCTHWTLSNCQCQLLWCNTSNEFPPLYNFKKCWISYTSYASVDILFKVYKWHTSAYRIEPWPWFWPSDLLIYMLSYNLEIWTTWTILRMKLLHDIDFDLVTYLFIIWATVL